MMSVPSEMMSVPSESMTFYDRKAYKYRLELLTKEFTRKNWYHYFKLLPKISFRSNAVFWVTYNVFMDSTAWREYRKDILKTRGKTCEICHKEGYILHHLKYINIGKELDKHIQVVCPDCHNKLHILKKQDNDEFYDETQNKWVNA